MTDQAQYLWLMWQACYQKLPTLRNYKNIFKNPFICHSRYHYNLKTEKKLRIGKAFHSIFQS